MGICWLQSAYSRGDENSEARTGDAWLWTALCANTKHVVAFRIGERAPIAYDLLMDMNERLDGRRIQLTTDGWRPYPTAIGYVYDPADVDFAQLQKQYGPSYDGQSGSAERRYSPAVCIGAVKVPISDNP